MMCGVGTTTFRSGSRSDKQVSNQAIVCFVSVLLSLLLTACEVQMGTTSATATVTLATFSGRPNPRWNLNQEQVAVIREIITSLQPTDRPLDTSGWPPYGGFLVEGEDIVASASELEVYNGIISVRDGSHQELGRLRDLDYRVERYLFETGQAYLDAVTYQKAMTSFMMICQSD